MIVNFRQGIVQYKHPTFIQVNFPYVSLLADTSAPLVLNIAYGTTNYLHAEKANVDNAWGPIALGVDVWLYIDINVRTAQRTFGTTVLEPIVSSTAPSQPSSDQHWFDTTTNTMKVWSGFMWVTKIRVFICMLSNGKIPTSVSAHTPDFDGTQVHDLSSVLVGYILFDGDNNPIKNISGQFVTSESTLRVSALSVSDVKVASLLVTAESQQNLPAYTIVQFEDFGKISAASSFVSTTQKQYGIIETDAIIGDFVNVTVNGTITNVNWDWTSVGVNAYLYNDNNGVIVTTPVIPQQYPIATVIDKHTILLAIKTIINDPLSHTHVISDVTGLRAELDSKASAGGATFTGTITAPTFEETTQTVSIVGGVLTLDLSVASVFKVTLDDNITSVGLINVPGTTGTVGFTIKFTTVGTNRTINWPSNIKWPGGAPPTISSTTGAIDVFSFYTDDNGVTFLGFVAGQSFS